MTNIIHYSFGKKEENRETSEYYFRVQFVALAYAQTVQDGQTDIAKRLLSALQASQFDTFVVLEKDLEEWVEKNLDAGRALYYQEELLEK
jgi:hypothetical protein